jgi:hypothetical protein
MITMKPWEVVKFPWGTGIKHSKGGWEKIFLSPDGQEVDVSKLDIVLHQNGIEIRGDKR